MKKIIIIIFCVFTFCINDVLADANKPYDCTYIYGENKAKLTLTYDISKGTYKPSGQKNNDKDNLYSYFYFFTDDEVKYYAQNKCPTLHMFYQNTSLEDQDKEYHIYSIYSSTYLLANSTYASCLDGKDNISTGCILGILGADKYKYYEMHLSSDEENSGKEEFSNCPQTNKKYSEIKENYQLYKTHGDFNYVSAANNQIIELKKVCKNILTNMDYQLSNGVTDACVDFCLTMEDEINKLKREYKIPINSSDRQCGFSEKLILFIANIVKWIKYIIPVVVIVLGILDFIQAIAADKDDMMKKAQGRFVKRLIAAALIFIIPFIIEFVLDKMGFGSTGCGIIDL